MRNLLTLADLTSAEIERIFSITEDLKNKYQKGLREPLLPGRMMVLVFEKPSLRTRVSFEAGMVHLGGSSMFLGTDAGFGRRESVADFARVLGEYADVVVIRANRHQTAVDMAKYCSCSVINGLTDFGHPCQALADLYTIGELVGNLSGHTLAWIGDANNVARSLAVGCGKLGLRLAMATPKGYQFDEKSLAWIRQQAPKLDLFVTTDPAEAVRDAVAIYTDVWASMGQESERDVRRQAFAAYQVNAELMSRAQRGAFFMHCLPARRGEEVTDEVIDGPQSVVIQQAANRMHVQKGILAWMLGREGAKG
ncbi:MAG: ornithine carbamoyltransferase [Planctomycetaceae bacterium]|nr:ornithine carbamoyltransferase [Planctomycetaceae bacterium]